MSVTIFDRPMVVVSTVCDETLQRKRKNKKMKSVRFSPDDTLTQVKEVRQLDYPNDYFYTRSETDRFRQEAKAERLGSSTSPVQRAFNIASSSCIMVAFLIIGIVSATIASLPLLLLLKVSSSVFSYYDGSSHDDIIDSSIYSPPSNDNSSNGNSIIEHSLLLGALGPQLSCTK